MNFMPAGFDRSTCVVRIRTLILSLTLPLAAAGNDLPWFGIKVVDQDTGRGVPMVELKTVNHIRHFTDSHGYIAFHEPGVMGSNVFFHVSSHGYKYPKDRFGNRGRSLTTTLGSEEIIRIKRLNVAERLYRITGGGIYRDTILLGKSTPLQQPVLNGSVFGQDSVNAIPYRGLIHWFWGDSNRPGYPLGNFHTSGATSVLPGKGGLHPSNGIDLNYFVDAKGFSKKMAPLAGKGIVWIFGLIVLEDATGSERMVAHYTRMKNLGTMLEHGLVIFNDQRQEFEKLIEFDLDNRWATLSGHPFRQRDQGQDWFLIPRPLPNVRVQADFNTIQKQDAYEAFSCLVPGTEFAGRNSQIERDAEGRVVYAWKRNTAPTGPAEERQLTRLGLLDRSATHFQPQDVETEKIISLHFSTVRWNEHRQRWVMIGVQAGGDSSYLGEVWYGEARLPTGPWLKVRRIVTHDHYSFYNPCHHAFFDQENGRYIFFEGTYTSTFSAAEMKTPRYDYNQIMYRLDLNDPRLETAQLR